MLDGVGALNLCGLLGITMPDWEGRGLRSTSSGVGCWSLEGGDEGGGGRGE